VSLIRADVPQIYLNVDREAAFARGVGTGQIYSTLQAMLSTLYINDFNLYGRTYRVQAEAQAPFRQKPEDIGRFHVRSDRGEMIPLSALTTIEMRGGPSIVSRFNGFTSALVTGTPKPGRSSGEMLEAVERLVEGKYAGQGIGFAYSGQSYQERAAEGGATVVVVLGLILVFLVLAAQYESFTIPFAVLLGIPFGILGALAGAFVRGMPNDVYFQVGIIAVMGLAAKNSILMVEFANQLRAEGRSIYEAAVEAARERFRPILMTSFAFIFGVAPLVIASGAGAMSRHSIGTGVFFGMLTATTIGIFFIPLFFSVIRGLAERGFSRRGRPAMTPVPASPESQQP
jgi:multidrug efflux pump subunit AcrB